MIDIQAMFNQTAFIRAVVTGTGWSGEKVACIGLQPSQKLVCTTPVNMFLIDLNKGFLMGHAVPPLWGVVL